MPRWLRSLSLAALLAAAVLGAFAGGSAFGRWRAERALTAALRAKFEQARARGEATELPKATKARKPRDPNRPKLLTHYRDGKVVGRELEHPITKTRTALPIDGPDPREPLKED